MIYLKDVFNNYEQFKEMFGMQEHGNGTKSRRNKILLQYFKSRDIMHLVASAKEEWDYFNVYDRDEKPTGRKSWYCNPHIWKSVNLYGAHSMDELRSVVISMLSCAGGHPLEIHGIDGIRSRLYDSDDFQGICEDGDVRSVRYVNCERQRVFKMRAGKFLRKIIEEHEDVDRLLPEQVKIWVCEDFAENWKAYAMNAIGSDRYTLYVNDNFKAIYDPDRCKGDFHSCMTGRRFWTFYRDSVDASAAYLEDCEGQIVARCIIYNSVYDSNDNKLRLAERQYSTGCDESLKRMLVMRLIEGGYIDGYKRIGADCHSPRAFLDIHGNPLEDDDLHIDCDLSQYDTVSYQDSFKYYDEEECVAYNYGYCNIDENLSTTNGYREDEHENDCYSRYHDEYLSEDEAYYVETRDDYFYGDEVVNAYVDDGWETCFREDCIYIGSDYYYAGEDAEEPERYGICQCPQCGDYFLTDDGCYSELTGEDYCCSSCLEEAEEQWHSDNGDVYSSWDSEWYDADEVIEVLQWNRWLRRYDETTISIDSFNSLVEDGEATEFCGLYYLDSVNCEGEPAHLPTPAVAA